MSHGAPALWASLPDQFSSLFSLNSIKPLELVLHLAWQTLSSLALPLYSSFPPKFLSPLGSILLLWAGVCAHHRTGVEGRGQLYGVGSRPKLSPSSLLEKSLYPLKPSCLSRMLHSCPTYPSCWVGRLRCGCGFPGWNTSFI